MSVLRDCNGLDVGWIEWGGGECPVADGAIVDVKFADETVFPKDDHPELWRWSHSSRSCDLNIIAYRIHKESSN